MNIKPALAFALALCVGGCSTLTTSQIDCTRLSREKQELIRSDLNHLLVSQGLTAATHPLSPLGATSEMGWWYAPLRKGSADFTVSAYTHPHEVWLSVDSYRLS